MLSEKLLNCILALLVDYFILRLCFHMFQHEVDLLLTIVRINLNNISLCSFRVSKQV